MMMMEDFKTCLKAFQITFQLPLGSGSGAAEMAQAWCLIDPVTHVMAAEDSCDAHPNATVPHTQDGGVTVSTIE